MNKLIYKLLVQLAGIHRYPKIYNREGIWRSWYEASFANRLRMIVILFWLRYVMQNWYALPSKQRTLIKGVVIVTFAVVTIFPATRRSPEAYASKVKADPDAQIAMSRFAVVAADFESRKVVVDGHTLTAEDWLTAFLASGYSDVMSGGEACFNVPVPKHGTAWDSWSYAAQALSQGRDAALEKGYEVFFENKLLAAIRDSMSQELVAICDYGREQLAEQREERQKLVDAVKTSKKSKLTTSAKRNEASKNKSRKARVIATARRKLTTIEAPSRAKKTWFRADRRIWRKAKLYTKVTNQGYKSSTLPFNPTYYSVVYFANRKKVACEDCQEDYLRKNYRAAQALQKITGIPAAITLAQGIAESNSGMSELARTAHNYYGIKKGRGWKGKTKNYRDDSSKDRFRVYANALECMRDHGKFLQQPLYDKLRSIPSWDYISWSNELSRVGYATDANYAVLLVSTIERLELWRFNNPNFRMPPT